MREPDGAVSGIFVHGVDVTDLVRSREALRESEAYLRAALDASAGGFYAIDRDGVTTAYNAAFLRMLGFDGPEDVIGHKLHEVIHHTRPDGTPYPADACPVNRTALTGESAHVADEVFFRPDGSSFPVEYWSQPIVRDGELRGAVTNFIDVTDRKRAEARLREESDTVETINRIGRAVAAELDLERLVQTVVDETTRLTGAQFGAFFYNVVNEKGESYSLYAIAGVDRAHFDKFPMPRNTDIFAPTFAGDGVVRLDDVTADPRYGKNAPYHGMPKGHLPVRSYLAVLGRLPVRRGAGRAVLRTRAGRRVRRAARAAGCRDRRTGGGRHRQRPAVRGGEAGERRERPAAGQRAGGAGRGRAAGPAEGRVRQHDEPRTPHAR